MAFLPSAHSNELSAVATGRFNPGLVALSVVVAMLAAYTTLEVLERIKSAQSRIEKIVWLCLGSVCFGAGVWSMHFLGTLGLSFSIPESFSLGFSVLSLVPAMLAGGTVLYFLARDSVDALSLILTAVLIAGSMQAMDYMGAESEHLQGAVITYTQKGFFVSLSVVFLLATAMLALRRRLQIHSGFSKLPGNIISGVVLGVAFSAMQYTDMLAEWIQPGPTPTFVAPGVPLADLETDVSVLSILLISTVLVASILYHRLKGVANKWSVVGIPLSMAIAAMALLYVSWMIIDRLDAEARTEVRSALQTVLDTTHQAIRSWRDDNIEAIQGWASSNEVIAAATTLAGTAPDKAALLASPAQANLRSLFPVIDNWSHYRGYYLIDRQGINIGADHDAEVGTRSPLRGERAFWRRVWSGKADFSPPMQVHRGNKPGAVSTLFVGAPVVNAAGKVIAALAFSIDPAQDFLPILEGGRIGKTGETYAFNKSGLLLSKSRYVQELRDAGLIGAHEQAMLNLVLHNPGANLSQGQLDLMAIGKQPLTEMVNRGAQRQSGTNVHGYLNYLGTPVVGAWHWDESLQYAIGSEQQLQEALAPFYTSRTAVLALAGAACGALVILAIFTIISRLALLENQQRTDAILETTLDGVLTWDVLGYVLSANPGALAIFGLTAAEAKQCNLQSLIPVLTGATYEDVRKNFDTQDDELLAFRVETTGVRKNGARFPMDISVSETIVPGGERLFTGIVHDITNRKQAEADLLKEVTAREQWQHDLDIARDIQLSMLPLEFPPFPERENLDIFASLNPAYEVGGDFYDFFELGDGRICFVIGDVSGKGVPSALFMAMAKSLINSHASAEHSPGRIMSHINNELLSNNRAYMFVTLFICVFNPDSGELVYSNGGHNPPYVLRNDLFPERIEDIHGPAVGIVSDVHYGEGRLFLDAGEALFLYTDGVTEAMDPDRNLFGADRLAALLESLSYDSAKNIVDIAGEQVEYFREGSMQSDDITIMAVRRVPVGSEANVWVLELTIENKQHEIDIVNAQFNEFAASHDIDKSIMQRFNVVFDELINNIISYAYEDHETVSKIRIRAELWQDRIEVSIASYGVEFDPTEAPAPDVSAPLHDREPGGLGIHIVRNLMDGVFYHRRINQNVINLLKYLG